MSTEVRYPYYNPEIWGGLECTINRVNNEYRDQLKCAGHYTRENDIELIAKLGIRKLRYPVLWEIHEPAEGMQIDWNWIDNQLKEICSHNITPIAGLVHHGSGPCFTDLHDENFPQKLASYAGKVASRFPWLEYYTPVNEPLTTARFSGLYGYWYPHHTHEHSFLKMIVNQIMGIVLSMQAIRKINPRAKLVQTEDLSRTHSRELLNYQAQFENERRWLTYDLLCGKVDSQHYLWDHFLANGISEKELRFFIDNPCPPDIAGFNYYVTSERWLDERIENFPAFTHGGNGRHQYVDSEAVRHTIPAGLGSLLTEAWERYQIPMAVTECHLNCTREEQMRWFKECFDTCVSLNEKGINVKAVTAWSLLGAFDWNSLLTCRNDHYEAGVFDLQNNSLRPTALTKMIRSIATRGKYDHPLVNEKGWWRRSTVGPELVEGSAVGNQQSKLLIIGRSGTLGNAFARICEQRNIPFVALSRNEMDISKESSIETIIDLYKPWAIINASGYVRVDEAESNKNECFAANATGPGLIASQCRQKGIRFMTFSSDLVFDGNKNSPYHEADNVMPLNVYGASKAEGEKMVQSLDPASLIIRTSAFFGPWDKYNFVFHVLESLKNDLVFHMPGDVIVSPTYVPDLVHTALDLFIDEEQGIWHLSNEGMLTWADLASMVAGRGGFNTHKLVSRPLIEMGWQARRPLYSVLQSEKGVKMPDLENALERYFVQKAI